MAAPNQRRSIVKDVVADLQQPTTWAALPPEAAVINQRVRVVLTGLTGGACHTGRVLAAPDGHLRSLGHCDLRPLLRQLARSYRATTIQIDAPAFSVQDHRWQP